MSAAETPAGETAPETAATTTASAAQQPAVAVAPRWLVPVVAALAAFAALALGLSWNTQQRLRQTEQEVSRRQQDSGSQAVEARTLARQADAGARDAVAKVALLEARVAENALQRGQLEELLQSLSRSRDENILATQPEMPVRRKIKPLVGMTERVQFVTVSVDIWA